MKFTFLVLGKPKFPFVEEGMEHYLEQIGHMAEVECVVLKDHGQSAQPEKEAVQFQDALQKRKAGGAKVFLLDEKGKLYSSEQFAQQLGALRDQGISRFFFLVGGAYGFAPELRSQYPLLSLSPMTFPHDLARMLLAEQVYRALHILAGGKYHHA